MRFYQAEGWISDQLARVPGWAWAAGVAAVAGGCWLADALGYGPAR